MSHITAERFTSNRVNQTLLVITGFSCKPVTDLTLTVMIFLLLSIYISFLVGGFFVMKIKNNSNNKTTKKKQNK